MSAIYEGASALESLGMVFGPIRPNTKIPAGGKGWKATHAVTTTAEMRQRGEIFGWRTYSNYCILAGESGLVVIDEDTFGELDRWAEARGVTVPATLTVSTPRGGRHLYFRHDHDPHIGNVGRFKQSGYDIDVRGAGGYVLGPGSVIDGREYQIVDDTEPVALPHVLLTFLTSAAKGLAA